MKRLIFANATHFLAASGVAAADLFGHRWQQDPRVRLLFCAIDLEPFRRPVNRTNLRSEFGIRASDIVFGHVGRFDAPKNQRFLVEIAAEIVKREPRARFLLVGDGPLRIEIEERATALGLRDNIVFAGSRPDIPRLMLGAMDTLIFPSLYEGLPLVLMEAQGAGLPCLISDSIATEAVVNPMLCRRLALSDGASEWAHAACEMAAAPRCDHDAAIAAVENSPFSIDRSAKELTDLYADRRAEVVRQ